MKDIFQQLFSLLTSNERRKLALLFIAILLMAGLEVVSVASVMPLLSVASDPASVQDNVYLKWAFEAFEFSNVNSFLIALGICAFLALAVSNGTIVLVTWLQERYVWNCHHSISRRLLQSYLQQPYEYYTTRNSADMSKNILEETREVSTKLLRPALNGAAKAIVATAIIGFLVFINPVVAFLVAVIMGGLYETAYLLTRNMLDDIGEVRVEANRNRYQSVSEVFGGIKEVKLRGKENVFVQKFDQPSKQYAHSQALSETISKTPRYLLDAVAFGSIILVLIYLVAIQGNFQQVVPMLGLYAFAGYRLMPALQKAFQGMSKARFNKAALEALHRDMHQVFSPISSAIDDQPNMNTGTGSLELREGIAVNDVTFRYPGADMPAIRNLTLSIPAKTTVGFVGKTGSGKTTAVDLLLGLLHPETGEIIVDGAKLEGNRLKAWKRTVGYVPQHIYLSDSSIGGNIAFGIPDGKVDHSAVKDAARRAQLVDFLEQLPRGLKTVVGERGVKLSGGQRQRIGIARALYHQPSVVFFDEATSALDRETEQAVMDAIYALGETRTIILISHRLSTVEKADHIFMLEQGQLVGKGSFSDLRETNAAFRKMASVETP